MNSTLVQSGRMAPMQAWLDGQVGSLREFYPVRMVATPEAMCNLECEHCYWRHDISQSPVDWTDSVNRIIEMIKVQEKLGDILSLVYAGRILSKRGAKFMEAFISAASTTVSKGEIKEDSFFLAIVDNGYTILNYPEYLSKFSYINISVDGWRDAHDVQRRKQGSFDVAWNTIMQLKSLGYDPIAASAVGPLTIPSWNKFEDLLADNDIRSSVTFVWDMASTVERKVACIKSDADILAYFETLVSGVPKLINIYDTYHVRVLKPILKQFKWEVEESGDGLKTVVNGSSVLYRPASTGMYREFELLWDGKFKTIEAMGRQPMDQVPESQFQKVHQIALIERGLWEGIPIT